MSGYSLAHRPRLQPTHADMLPHWLLHYKRAWLASDVTAGLIVTVMLIPQSLAYSLLAGLPPQMGLYAGMLPIVAYALLGSSMTLAVGPVAVLSLMTASALAPLASAGSPEYALLAVQLALISGLMLVGFSALRLGFLANFLSHPVLSGFITGSAILIAIGQIKHLLGVPVAGTHLFDMLANLVANIGQTNPVSAAIGTLSLLVLVLARHWLEPLAIRLGLSAAQAQLLGRFMPMLVVLTATGGVALLKLDQTAAVSVVGLVPQGLPHLALPTPSWSGLNQLWLPALLISLVGFVESVSVAQALALKRQQRIAPNRELLGLGAANLASAISGSFVVTGGFARSVVNFKAGAHTPLAGVISAGLMALAIAAFTDLLRPMPHAVLAATIIVAVSALIDWHTLKQAWRYDRADAVSLLVTAGGVLLLGVEAGILMGVALSLAALVWRSSQPHMAVVGRVAGTEHFRNVLRHPVQTVPGLLALRIDESLFFANATAVEDRIESLLTQDPTLRHLLLICSAVNQIDTTALDMLIRLERSLAARGIVLLLAEVKGPVMDRLQPTELGQRLQGRVFLSTHEAFAALEYAQHPASISKRTA
jgi:sulfate permease, SulP family